MKKQPYRVSPPRPLTEDDLPEPKVWRLHWITKTVLFGSGGVVCMYALAWLTDHKMLSGDIGSTHKLMLLIATIGFCVAAFVCGITKGTFQ